MSIVTANESARWASLDMDEATEKKAAHRALGIFKEIAAAAQDVVAGVVPEYRVDLHNLCPIERQALAAWAEPGEVQIVLHADETVVEETGIAGLWFVSTKDSAYLSYSALPTVVTDAVSFISANWPTPVQTEDVFAAPAIFSQVEHAAQTLDLTQVKSDAAYIVELTRQPLKEGDTEYLKKAFGLAGIDVHITGFARMNLQATAIKGVWYEEILNNAGQVLLKAYAVALIPPEVGVDRLEMQEARSKLTELIENVEMIAQGMQ